MIALLLLILGLLPPFTAGDPLSFFCDNSSNYTTSSTFDANLELLSTTLPSNASSAPFLFAKGSVGSAPNIVHGLTLCRGDTNASSCHACVATAFQESRQRLCTHNKGATVFYDLCLLRFSYQDFLNLSSSFNDTLVFMWSPQNITEPLLPGWDPSSSVSTSAITTIISGLVQQTADHAAYNSTRRFATGRMDISSTFPTLFSLAQCTPDMGSTDCSACLQSINQQTTNFFSGQKGGRILGVRCNFRYEVYPFYNGKPMRYIGSPPGIVVPSTPDIPPPAPSNKHRSSKSKLLVLSLVVSLLASFFCMVLFLGFRRHRKGKGSKENAMNKELENEALVWEMEGRSSEFTVYNFSQILEATNNFSEENKLGQGGFGPVYKGRFPDGLEIAVKRLASHTGQGFTEFKNEIQLIAKLQHTNLVRLFGCCTQGEEKILIYEYLSNKSLDFFIFDETRRNILDWNQRLAIIDGIAQGLLYLHKHSRLRVIHRDLKASNILLDCEMNPKISDFGLAKIFSKNDSEANTQRIVGTYGYMAPEYASEGLFSIKSDVFSFGVLTLEMVSGKRASSLHQYGDFINILGHAWQLWKDGLWLQLLDASLATDRHTLVEMIRCINIALLCVQENAGDRPTMSDVIGMLNSESMALPEPKHPAYFHTRVAQEDVSAVLDTFDASVSAPHGR
ncbi:unnamed protein product [Urochloa humidicola]